MFFLTRNENFSTQSSKLKNLEKSKRRFSVPPPGRIGLVLLQPVIRVKFSLRLSMTLPQPQFEVRAKSCSGGGGQKGPLLNYFVKPPLGTATCRQNLNKKPDGDSHEIGRGSQGGGGVPFGRVDNATINAPALQLLV